MPVFLSPTVLAREIDLSTLPVGQGAMRPAFVGTAKKGPLNTPTLVTSAADFIDQFGEPFPTSYLGYAVLAYLQEGASCYVVRVGVEHKTSLPDAIIDDSIDTSGSRNQGWGRIPIFEGIDFGIIKFRIVNSDNPVVLHAASIANNLFTDADGSGSDAALTVSGTYACCPEEVFTVRITSDPVGTGALIDGAGYVVLNSAGDELASGTFSLGSGTDGETDSISIPDCGLSFTVNVTGAAVNAGDFFTFKAIPDNRSLATLVEGVAQSVTVAAGTYNTADDLVDAINAQTPIAYAAVVSTDDDGNDVPAIRTNTEGRWIQLTGSCPFAAAVGVSQYSFDIPRSYLVGTTTGPYTLTSANNRVVLDVIAGDVTTRLDFTLAAGDYDASTLASLLDANGTIDSVDYFESFSLTVPGGSELVFIASTVNNDADQLKLLATFTFGATLQFAEELGIDFPYTRAYRGFFDSRRVLPDIGTDGETPATCEVDPLSTDCSLDTDYYTHIVGWFVAKSAGTWSTDLTIGLSKFTDGVGDAAGRYVVTVYDGDGVAVDQIQDVTFNPADTRYIGNVVNEGSTIGGVNGNDFYQWDMRPSFLIDTDNLRQPSTFRRNFAGGADGIPGDASFSDFLDNAVIGSSVRASGLFSLQNPESFDITLLAIPGFTSGAVISAGLQFCEGRGDVLYLVDPPFGLRPQQVVDWHNGMLVSDLSAALNTSYGALYWGWLKVNDTFNGGTIFIPPSGHVASVFARTARVAEQWNAPAGINRGRLLSVVDLEYNPTQGERDLLYGSGNAVNPITKLANEGIVVYGQRTLQRRASALDRVNVRMLLIYLKRNLIQTLRGFQFEQNDAILRRQVVSTVNPFMADVAARRGITAFLTVCDESNNTPLRIDSNQLWVTVFFAPTKAAEFIALNLVVLRTGESFTAQEVLAAGGIVTG